ncbi:dihydrofolate reductase family protein [Paeniglutamicibacter cryotolerans]|uniref:Dihydrofolate reductase n=1 Tax=Paeniglutamicibacter cryotolerans TaxID=670079 RepID=A0A839QH67_9MICC|nr:dihydrofolate reductase family protein [Paeniglutamicibacter cryotolerans]MBB2995519.1 dihydrofolate reductase [Paeniglutamicibacter cryotolerans]
MGRLVYQASTSLDGYAADERGNFDFAAPDEEVHRHVNDGEASIGTYLLGRRMYETMRVWDDPELFGDGPDYAQDYARIWGRINKVVYSSDPHVSVGPATQLEPVFDPEAVKGMKSAARGDLGIGGATLAGQALSAGLVDEIRQYIHPVVIGGGLSWLPQHLHLDLEPLQMHRFESGVLFLSYKVR